MECGKADLISALDIPYLSTVCKADLNWGLPGDKGD